MPEELRWIPIESNPDVLNKLLSELGVPEPWRICDIYGLDEEVLVFVPQPVVSLLLLFPLTEKVSDFYRTEAEKRGPETSASSVYFLKQTIRNACGTIALLHAVANNTDSVNLDEGPLKRFLEETRDSSPRDRAKRLEEDVTVRVAHERIAREGQTRAPDREEDVDLHYVSFIVKDGSLWELDGRRDGPINHGPTTEETFLKDAAAAIRRLMSLDPEELHFTVLALAST